MIEKDFRILRWKHLVSLKCHSLKDYLCLCFCCHLVMFKGKADFRNWYLYLLSEPKWAELKKDLRLLLAALLWRPVIIPAGRQSPGLGWPQAVNKGSYRVTLISFPLQLAHLKVDERDELPRRKRGNCPAAHCQTPGPCHWPGCFQTCDNQAMGAHNMERWVGNRPGLGGGRERQWEGEIDSRKMLMISGHCRVTGLSAILMSCDTQKAVSTWLSSALCHPLSHTNLFVLGNLSLFIIFISSS